MLSEHLLIKQPASQDTHYFQTWKLNTNMDCLVSMEWKFSRHESMWCFMKCHAFPCRPHTLRGRLVRRNPPELDGIEMVNSIDWIPLGLVADGMELKSMNSLIGGFHHSFQKVMDFTIPSMNSFQMTKMPFGYQPTTTTSGNWPPTTTATTTTTSGHRPPPPTTTTDHHCRST